MDCWTILGIEPTADSKVIKQAYARLVKVYHPESDPEGFQKLRLAYEQAVSQSRWLAESQADERIIVDSEEGKDSIDREYSGEDAAADVVQSTVDSTADVFMEQFHKIFEDDKRRCELKEWEVLLQDEGYWALEIRQKLNYRVLRYLLERYQLPRYHLPNNIWQAFDNYFFWRQQTRELYAVFPLSFIDYMLKRIEPAGTSRYKGESLSEYPRYLLPALLVTVLIVAAMKIFSRPPGWNLFFALEMFIGGLFWGGIINIRLAKLLESRNIFDWVAPYCTYCNRRYKWRFPVLWFFCSRQECSECGKTILPYALVTEVVTGLVFAFSAYTISDMGLLLKLLVVFSTMLFIALLEYTAQDFPDIALIILAVIGVGTNLFLGKPNIQEMALGALIGGCVFLLIVRITKGWINKDFAKLIAAIGIVLGWKLLLSALVLWIAGLIVIGLAVLTYKHWLEAGIQLLCRRRFYVWLGILMIIGMKKLLLFLLIWLGACVFNIGYAGLKSRFRVLPGTAVLMVATYIVLLHQEYILKLLP